MIKEIFPGLGNLIELSAGCCCSCCCTTNDPDADDKKDDLDDEGVAIDPNPF